MKEGAKVPPHEVTANEAAAALILHGVTGGLGSVAFDIDAVTHCFDKHWANGFVDTHLVFFFVLVFWIQKPVGDAAVEPFPSPR